MRIITLCDGASISGGAEKVAITTAVELAKSGFDSSFFGAEGALDPLILSQGLKAHTLNLTDAYHTTSKKELLKRFFWNRDARAQWAAFLNDFDPRDTVVHVHSFRRILSTSVMEETFARGFKTVLTLHDFGLACPNTSFYNFESRSICTLDPFSPACFATQCTKNGWPMKGMQMGRGIVVRSKNVTGRIDRYVAVSEFSKKILAKYLPAGAKVDVVYNPVTATDRGPAEITEGSPFTFVGRMQPEKDPVTLAEAARIAGVPVRFIGDGPELEKVKAANPEAEITGWLSQSEVIEKVRSARAIVMPSRWYETAGLAILDALSQGLPGIVSEGCAATEFVTDCENGRLFKMGDAESLAAILTETNVELARKLGGAAYQTYWRKPFTVERYLAELTEVYSEVLPNGA